MELQQHYWYHCIQLSFLYVQLVGMVWYGIAWVSVCLLVLPQSLLIRIRLSRSSKDRQTYGTHTTKECTNNKRTNPIEFQGHGSKAKVTC